MFSDDGKISCRQMQILIIASNIGIGTILLPKIFFGYSPINLIWLLVFILLAVILILKATDKEQTFYENTRKNLGTGFAKLLNLMMLLKIILTSSIQVKLFSHIINSYILPNTNQFVITLIMVLAAWYLNLKGYESRGRLCEILIWLIIIPLATVFFITLTNINGLPNPNTKINLALSFESLFIFSQLDYLLLSGGLVKKTMREKITDAILVTWLAIIFLTGAISMRIKFPTPLPIIKLMSMTDIPGGFVQNQDFFIITFVIISFFILMSGAVFFSSKIFHDICPFMPNNYSKLIPPLLIALVSVPKTDFFCRQIICCLGIFFYFILPIFVITVKYIHKNVQNNYGDIKDE